MSGAEGGDSCGIEGSGEIPKCEALGGSPPGRGKPGAQLTGFIFKNGRQSASLSQKIIHFS
ncbi:hypothetical protein E2491_05745 [Jeotgalibacillus sp. R-1-5s-1]|nr:hypothetical protein E2491_05745 [Jeotgalibacillus sp. R-1-5s-1]